MTKREIANLCCKVLAIYMLIQAFFPLAFGLTIALETRVDWGQRLGLLLVSFLSPVLLAILALLLWRKSGIVAAWMVGHDLQDEQDEPDVLRVDAKLSDIHAVAFSCLGLWLLLTTVPQAAGWVASLALETAITTLDRTPGRAQVTTNLVDLLLRFILGMWLLFGGRGLVQLLHNVRNIGLDSGNP